MSGHSTRRGVVRLSVVLVVLACLSVAYGGEGDEYQGSEFCRQCHPTIYNDFRVSGHPYKLVSAEEAQVRPIPLPAGYSWDDISYVIGGYRWKSRYMGADGYIITTTDQDLDGEFETDGTNQWNYLTRRWVDYHAGEEKPYDCGRCHTTGWVLDDDWDIDDDLSDNQDGLPGIHGTFAFGGIQCEQCHGPFVDFPDHTMGGMDVDPSSAACGQCHIRGDSATIPASGGFIRHHEQYNEILASPHNELDCVECHDPHKQSASSIRLTCEDCHSEVAESYADSAMDLVGVTCTDCHMPMASKSADALGPVLEHLQPPRSVQGDIKTHLFKINTNPRASLFDESGGFVLLDGDGQAGVTLDFACLSCHRAETMRWAAFYARNFHGSGPGQGVPFLNLPRLPGIFH